MKNCLCSLLLVFFSTLFVVVLGTNAAYSSVGETTDELMRLFFTRWGNGNLTLEDVDNKTGLQVFQLNGSTNEAPSGYNSYHNYTGRYIVISLADVSKSQYNNQISLVVDVNGTGKEYDLVFVNGRLEKEGWDGTTYYKKIYPYSNLLIDLQQLVASVNDVYSSMNKITIGVEGNTTVNEFNFQINLIRGPSQF